MLGVLAVNLLLLLNGPQANRVRQDSIESPTLRTLARNASADPTVVPRFWDRVEGIGAPLVEPIPGDSTTRLVTFVWRGADTLSVVAVITPHALIDIEHSRMRHLAHTDVWHRSFRMRSDARMVYRFGPGDSMRPFMQDRDLGTRMSRWQLDPLNPDAWTFADGTRASVLRLAGSSDHVADRPPRGRGTIRIDTVSGAGPWRNLQVAVYLPPGQPARLSDRPLVVLMDGDAYLRLMNMDSVLDRLDGVSPDRIPVVVLVPPGPTSRTVQYDCNPDWSDFLAEVLVPWIEQRYPTSRQPQDRIVGGYSLGALAAACAAVRHPATFGNVLAQSGSFYRSSDSREPESLARTLAEVPRLPVRWSLAVGLLETSDLPSRDPSMLTATRHLRDVLIAKGYVLGYTEFYGGHEHIAWADHLPDMLGFLLNR